MPALPRKPRSLLRKATLGLAALVTAAVGLFTLVTLIFGVLLFRDAGRVDPSAYDTANAAAAELAAPTIGTVLDEGTYGGGFSDVGATHYVLIAGNSDDITVRLHQRLAATGYAPEADVTACWERLEPYDIVCVTPVVPGQEYVNHRSTHKKATTTATLVTLS